MVTRFKNRRSGMPSHPGMRRVQINVSACKPTVTVTKRPSVVVTTGNTAVIVAKVGDAPLAELLGLAQFNRYPVKVMSDRVRRRFPVSTPNHRAACSA